jgi:hypothetical protein
MCYVHHTWVEHDGTDGGKLLGDLVNAQQSGGDELPGAGLLQSQLLRADVYLEFDQRLLRLLPVVLLTIYNNG